MSLTVAGKLESMRFLSPSAVPELCIIRLMDLSKLLSAENFLNGSRPNWLSRSASSRPSGWPCSATASSTVVLIFLVSASSPPALQKRLKPFELE